MNIGELLSRLKKVARPTRRMATKPGVYEWLLKKTALSLLVLDTTIGYSLWHGPLHWLDRAQLEPGLSSMVPGVPIRIYRNPFFQYYSYDEYVPEQRLWYTTWVYQGKTELIAKMWSWSPIQWGWSDNAVRAVNQPEQEIWQRIFAAPVYLTNPHSVPTR